MTTILNANFCKLLGIMPQYTDLSDQTAGEIKSISKFFKRWEVHGGYAYAIQFSNGCSVSAIKHLQSLGNKTDEWEILYNVGSNWYRRGWLNEEDLKSFCQKLYSL